MTRQRIPFKFAVVGLLLTSGVLLGHVEPPTPAQEALNAKIKLINQQLASKDEASLDLAVPEIRELLDSGQNPSNLRNSWLTILSQQGRHREVAEFAWKVMLLTPDAKISMAMMDLRANALLATNDPTAIDDALVAAKVGFNVCEVAESERAIGLLLECVEKKYPTDPGVVRRFKLDVVGMTRRDGADKEHSAAIGGGLLQGITINKALADDLSARAEGLKLSTGFGDRIKYGNLLLASGQASEAETVFWQLYASDKDPKNRALAGEAIARALRARDGSVAVEGASNKWLEELNTGTAVQKGMPS